MQTQARSARALRHRGGFTLAEMMVVIVIIGLLTTLVVPNVLERFARAARTKAKVDIAHIVGALKEYAMSNGGKYPDSLEPLVSPDVNGSTYLDSTKVPRDPWGHEYMYDAPSPGQPLPRVYSYARDGAPGGVGWDADIDSLTMNDDEAR
jgi:general secretion pathway protein G